MKLEHTIGLAILVPPLVGCGGGSGGTSAAATMLHFSTPVMNSAQTFSVTWVDFVSTSTDSIVQTITGVNPDGSFSYTESLAAGTTLAGNHFRPSSTTADSAGRVLSITYNPGTSSAVTCTFSPHGPGPDFPLTVGATWQSTYAETCTGQMPVTYTQGGSVVDTESITLPAGTFAAIKLQSTISWVFGPGMASEAVTRWLDSASGHPIKTQATYTWGVPAALVQSTDLKKEDSVLTAQ